MGEVRSPRYASETFHERLRAAGLPERLQSSIGKSLAVFFEDDCDGITPDERSFAALLSFVSNHRRWVTPGLTINQRGDFIAVWEISGIFRWSIEFLPDGCVAWTELEKSPKAEVIRRSGRGRADALELPQQLRRTIFAD